MMVKSSTTPQLSRIRRLGCAAVIMLLAPGGRASPAPVELGAVHWLRDLDQGLEQSQRSGRPVLILFQEIPGCQTCRNYGTVILSHPLVAEAIEDLFVPVAVYNNRGGTDGEALERFGEPAWNNPVVRIVDADGRGLAERVGSDYTQLGLLQAMTGALTHAGREIPGYLRLLEAEAAAASRPPEQATFAMACFWAGEGRLGAIDGVVDTLPGYLHGEEAVEVRYDPKVVSFDELVGAARKLECARTVFTRSAEQLRTAEALVGRRARPASQPLRPDREPKYYLAQTPYRYVPMTALQAARVNGAIGTRTDPAAFLSPRQRTLLQTVLRHPNGGWPNVIGERDLAAAWTCAQRIAADPRLPKTGTLHIE